MRFFAALLFLIGVGTVPACVDAAQIVNVDYIVQYAKQKWDIPVPYQAEQKMWAANTRYLLGVVDWINKKFNGKSTSDYISTEYATSHAVDTVAANAALDRLVRPEYKFFFTPATTDKEYTFRISAAGTYVIDWGDGKKQYIEKTDVAAREFSHTYADAANKYNISLGGRATRYSTGTEFGAITFYDGNYYDNTAEENKGRPEYVNPYGIKSMRGCLGCVFPTIDDTSVAENARQPRFRQTFAYNSKLNGEIPTDLFDGVHGAPVSYMFYGTFSACKGLTGGIPEKLFAGIQGAPAAGMFYNTFSNCTGLTGGIPEKLFGGISGKPASHMFRSTFYGCSNLSGGIPEKLFAGITGAPATYMFQSTFNGCSGLTGSIQKDLFAGISGAPADSMFRSTFYGCSNLSGGIPEKLFGGITGAPAPHMFRGTFMGCSGLSDNIPGNLFAGVQGAPAENMFQSTFYGCSGLTGNIPANLFAGISGKPATQMFHETFYLCRNLSTIPSGLFAGVQGAPAASMFYDTFNGCSGLTGSIPKDLFAGISGAPADSMFRNTFKGCKNLSGSIPENLFGGITGSPANYMFYSTFNSCSKLTGIPENLFGDITGNAASKMFDSAFYGCSNMTGYSAKVGKPGERVFLYERWPDAGDSAYSSDTKLIDYDCIPEYWGGAGTSTNCSADKFFFTPATDSNEYTFRISAAGTFYIDWGDGKAEKIKKTDTGTQEITHTFPGPASGYNVSLGGVATKYSTTNTVAAISFYDGTYQNNTYGVKSIRGCLGCVFGTTDAGEQPRFYNTFAHNTKLTSAIPENLFDGVTGAPVGYMFSATFSGTGITSIPEKLFAGIQGAPAEWVFSGTFSDTGITSIPEKLFSGIQGAPAAYMFEGTFADTGITSIPEKLFSGISGAPAEGMFQITFYSTAALQNIPEKLFAGVQGAPADRMFWGAFQNTGITSIPAGLFGGIRGEPAPEMFEYAFAFSNISDIPAGLFDGIRGAPAVSMFSNTFGGCHNLTKIPDGLFANINGYVAPTAFGGTFIGCENLEIIGRNLFGDIVGDDDMAAFDSIFSEDYALTGKSATVGTGENQQYLWQRWPNSNGYAGYMGAKLLDDYYAMPEYWTKDYLTGSYPVFEFSVTPADGLTELCFDLAVAGTFWFDSDADARNMAELQLTDTRSRQHCVPIRDRNKIRFGGWVTAYAPDGWQPTIQFRPGEIKAIDGCLGCLFPTLPDGSQPSFYNTFYNNPELTRIPENFFDGITGELRDGMFMFTFKECPNLTGPSARINGRYLYEIWPNATENQVGGCYGNDTGLDDFNSIPYPWAW